MLIVLHFGGSVLQYLAAPKSCDWAYMYTSFNNAYPFPRYVMLNVQYQYVPDTRGFPGIDGTGAITQVPSRGSASGHGKWATWHGNAE